MENIGIYRNLAVFLVTGRGRGVKRMGSGARLLLFPQWGELEEVGVYVSVFQGSRTNRTYILNVYVCVYTYVHICAYMLYVHIHIHAICMHICVHECVYMERERFYFMEFAHVTAGLKNATFAGLAGRLEIWRSWCFCLKSKGNPEAEFFPLWGTSILFLHGK